MAPAINMLGISYFDLKARAYLLAVIGLMWGHNKRIALLACGSFNPPTVMHLRMMELAKDAIERGYKCEVVEGIMSPVSDGYGKRDLAPAEHRLNMLQLAARYSDWIIPDSWEARQQTWTRTVEVLRYHQQRIHKKYGPDVRLALVVGSDVVETFTRKDSNDQWVWNKDDLISIVRDHGIVSVVREGVRPHTIFDSVKFLASSKDSCLEIHEEVCPNMISSTLVRKAIRENRTLKYVVDDAIITYIKKHDLYSPMRNHQIQPL